MLVVDFETPDGVRAYARFDAEAVAAAGDGRRSRRRCSARAISP